MKLSFRHKVGFFTTLIYKYLVVFRMLIPSLNDTENIVLVIFNEVINGGIISYRKVCFFLSNSGLSAGPY